MAYKIKKIAPAEKAKIGLLKKCSTKSTIIIVKNIAPSNILLRSKELAFNKNFLSTNSLGPRLRHLLKDFSYIP